MPNHNNQFNSTSNTQGLFSIQGLAKHQNRDNSLSQMDLSQDLFFYKRLSQNSRNANHSYRQAPELKPQRKVKSRNDHSISRIKHLPESSRHATSEMQFRFPPRPIAN